MKLLNSLTIGLAYLAGLGTLLVLLIWGMPLAQKPALSDFRPGYTLDGKTYTCTIELCVFGEQPPVLCCMNPEQIDL